MYIKKISFQNFRNFETLELNLRAGFVVLTGPNGAGKTNFLEGLYWAGALRRFPGSRLAQLLKDQGEFYKISLQFHGAQEESQELICEKQEDKFSAQGRPASGWKFTYKYNNLNVSRGEYTNHLPVISFLPEDLNLLGHSPSGRRRFLDEGLSAVSADYRYNILQYQKALQQRNQALRTTGELEIWDTQLSEFGSAINKGRAEFIAFANSKLSEILEALSPDLTNPAMIYHMSGSDSREKFHEKLLASRGKEQEILTTVVGPHRDDFELFDNNRAIVGYLSRGQMRSITLALKVVEREYLKDRLAAQPVMLLDDVFSELDEPHQGALAGFLRTMDQVFLTTTHLKEVQAFLPPDVQLYNVGSGVITTSPL